VISGFEFKLFCPELAIPLAEPLLGWLLSIKLEVLLVLGWLPLPWLVSFALGVFVLILGADPGLWLI